MSGSLPESLLCFLQEAEGLKSVERTAWTSSGRRESTAEHSWRLALLAWGGFLLLTLLTRYVSLGSIYAASSFPVGTWLFVSHDRYFINRFATRVWELEEQRITDYPMGFARYRKIKAEQSAKKAEPEKAVKEKSLTEKPQRGNKNQQAARRQLTICEREIAQQEEALAALDARLEEAASDYEKYSALYAEKEAQEQKLTELMERWEALAAEAGE
mgnify:CR=1 FL=1